MSKPAPGYLTTLAVCLCAAVGLVALNSAVRADSVSKRRVALNAVSVGDTSDIITTSVASTAPAGHVVLVRGSYHLTGANSVVEFVRYDAGGSASVATLNSGGTCHVGNGYTFSELVPSDWTWNVRCQTSGGYLTLVADEVRNTP